MNKTCSISLAKNTEKLFSEFLKDDDINEICYNGTDCIYIQDYKGFWKEHKTKINLTQIEAFVTTLASYKNDVIGNKKPILSATLNTGERVQVVVSPATKENVISVTIRKPSKSKVSIEDFEKQGLFSEVVHNNIEISNPTVNELKKMFDKAQYKEFLSLAVKYGLNIVIAGSTGSGKTTLMKALIDFIPLEERIITIEDTEEIKFYEHKNFVQLFYPSEAKEGDLLNSATLLKSCLRMKPDRILLAELRGAETYDFLNVVSSGHNGSITSCHAGSVKETFTRLALMILQNPQGQKLPFEIIQENLKNVIDVVVHISNHNGKRRISEIYYKEVSNAHN